MKKIIHINQHNIKHNTKTGDRKPVITCKTYKENVYGHEVIICDKNGEEVARIKYSPDKPLSCGAKVWLECSHNVIIKENEEIFEKLV